MDLALLCGRILLAAVFAVAGVAKLLNPAETRKTIAEFGVRPILANSLGSLLPAAELAVAVFLLAAPWAWWGALGALTLLSTFIAAIAMNLLKGRTPACHCFGQIRSKPIGWVTAGRNAALALCAGLIVWAGPNHASSNAVNGLASALQIRPLTLVITVCVLTALAAETVLLWQLVRQHGRLLLRMDQFEQRLAVSASPVQQGLSVGTVAPSFALATPSRTTLELATLRQAGTPVVLMFSDPNCQPCATLLPEVGQWQHQYAEHVKIAVVSRGSEHANRRMAQRYDLADVLIQTADEVSEAYQVPGTPAAVFIRADGTIGHEVALGRDAIHNLLIFVSKVSSAGVRRATPTPNSESDERNYGTITR
jgi:methylamine dehydrogenase accessory protein MauD